MSRQRIAPHARAVVPKPPTPSQRTRALNRARFVRQEDEPGTGGHMAAAAKAKHRAGTGAKVPTRCPVNEGAKVPTRCPVNEGCQGVHEMPCERRVPKAPPSSAQGETLGFAASPHPLCLRALKGRPSTPRPLPPPGHLVGPPPFRPQVHFGIGRGRNAPGTGKVLGDWSGQECPGYWEGVGCLVGAGMPRVLGMCWVFGRGRNAPGTGKVLGVVWSGQECPDYRELWPLG